MCVLYVRTVHILLLQIIRLFIILQLAEIDVSEMRNKVKSKVMPIVVGSFFFIYCMKNDSLFQTLN